MALGVGGRGWVEELVLLQEDLALLYWSSGIKTVMDLHWKNREHIIMLSVKTFSSRLPESPLSRI